MQLFFFATLGSAALGWLMGILSLFLILLILVQRGKGGGLTGALGGPGGQSAFGSKAGDTFTVITVIAASIWAFVCGFAMWSLGTSSAPIADLPTAKQEDTGVSVSPGPFDPTTESDTSGLSGPGSLGGFGSQATEQSTEPTDGDTPSMQLEPAEPTAPADAEGDSPAGDQDSSPASDEVDSAADDGSATAETEAESSAPESTDAEASADAENSSEGDSSESGE